MKLTKLQRERVRELVSLCNNGKVPPVAPHDVELLTRYIVEQDDEILDLKIEADRNNEFAQR